MNPNRKISQKILDNFRRKMSKYGTMFMSTRIGLAESVILSVIQKRHVPMMQTVEAFEKWFNEKSKNDSEAYKFFCEEQTIYSELHVALKSTKRLKRLLKNTEDVYGLNPTQREFERLISQAPFRLEAHYANLDKAIKPSVDKADTKTEASSEPYLTEPND